MRAARRHSSPSQPPHGEHLLPVRHRREDVFFHPLAVDRALEAPGGAQFFGVPGDASVKRLARGLRGR
jgi:hypothetical protein